MEKTVKNHKWFGIRQKLMMSYSVLVLIIFLLGGAGVYGIYKVNANSISIYHDSLQAASTLRYLNQNLHEIDRQLTLLSTGAGERDSSDYIYDILVLQTQNGYLLDDYGQLSLQDAAQYETCRNMILDYNKKVDAILEQLEAGEAAEGFETTLQQELVSMLDAMAEQSILDADERNLESQRIFTSVIAAVIAVCIAAVLLASIIAFYISNYFSKRLETIRSFAKRMAEYDISDDIENTVDDEIGRTIMALNDSQFKIRDLIEKIIHETADMGEMGADISNALRKTASRLQAVSVLIMQSSKMADNMDTVVMDILAISKLEESTAERLRTLLPVSDGAREMLLEAMGEMNGIIMHLEQIAVTSDYQNELAKSHKERINRFKLQQSTASTEVSGE